MRREIRGELIKHAVTEERLNVMFSGGPELFLACAHDSTGELK